LCFRGFRRETRDDLPVIFVKLIGAEGFAEQDG